MARYELANKFWEITCEGCATVVRWGKSGAASVSSSQKVWPDLATAKKQHDKLVREKLAAGFVAVTATRLPIVRPKKTTAPAEDRSLVEAILADPEDPQPYLVYADWLQGQSDPRGELIVLQHRVATTTAPAKKKELAKKAKAYFDRHTDALLGPLVPFVSREKYRRGRSFDAEWHCGFIRKLAISWGMYDNGGTEQSATAELTAILEHPSARFITDLELGPAPASDEMSLDCLIAALVATGRPEALRTLHLGNTGDWDISSTSTGFTGELAKRFRRLRELTLEGGNVAIGKLDLPELVSFKVRTGGLDKAEIKAICDAKWPNLERLEIYFGEPYYGGNGAIKDIAPILAGRGLAKLTHLGLVNCSWADDIARALPAAKIVKQLTHLDLSMGALSDAGITAMAAQPKAFAHLTSLNVGDSALTDAGIRTAKQLGKVVDVGKDQTPERADQDSKNSWARRYVSVGE